MTPILQVEDLSIYFHTDDRRVHAVDRVSLTLGEGEVLGVVGESGCGKSVTAMAILQLLPRTAAVTGRVVFQGVDLLTESSANQRRVRGGEIAFVFQEPMTSLNPVYTIGRQIGEAVRQHRGLSKREAKRRCIELLDLVHIPAAARRIDEYPHQLSGGMRQRAMIAMALAGEPKVLIADEPTTALDVTIQAGILDLLREIRELTGISVLLITHNLGVVADVADRVIVMYAGRKVEEASVEELFSEPRHPYTVGLLGALPRAGVDRLQEIPGRVPSLEAMPDACVFSSRCDRSDNACVSSQPALRTIGGAHTVACVHPHGAKSLR